MPNIDLQGLLPSLIAGWEGECVEFKEANDNFPTSDIGSYEVTPCLPVDVLGVYVLLPAGL